ncbi:MAG: diaminopimelate epimerase [Candidatus Eremiobacteraeota bacterium]|nr:diaminopimelate epimerase [Candidatus Eremiobacteraeota bacterium]
MHFVKMHGLGNDFIIADGRELGGIPPERMALSLCERRRGIGADGLLLYYHSTTDSAEFEMRLYNPDGSQAEMCGNGIRCLAKLLYDKNLVRRREFSIATKAGLKGVSVFEENESIWLVEVNMGIPRLRCREIPVICDGDGDSQFFMRMIQAGGRNYEATCVNMGNPHCVIFVEGFSGIRLHDEGKALEYHPLFPERTNVEFVKVRAADHLEVKVWERGAGETQACGTGACASLVAAFLAGKTGRTAKVDLPGGTLQVTWKESGEVFMKGPAIEVFAGEIPLDI